ncbi:protoporphyrinogen oxidase [Sulfitobacter sp. TSTF-M16]|uniref:Protoporphyrinogen oxidase n=1 Tax=Sulfitobacter aestuariivivens TaxID=2766981 RepID=A0A927D6L5_9RHOB|nr:flavodoxin domain-containing protein [Sulfitobacter aestuariivivens]MBD3665960.1 protoporphyrinogen oxidase [Sulfitobacter aestuariivivens]
MNVLILFESVEGQTQKIATFVADEVSKLGHTSTLANAEETAAVTFDSVDAVILAAPVHQRRHPRKFEALLAGFVGNLAQCRTMLLSISLSAAFPDGLEEAGEYVTEMLMRTRLKPDKTLLVAGAVRTSQYDYFATQVIRHVVMRGREYDASAGEHEFTDWGAISDGVRAFLNARV